MEDYTYHLGPGTPKILGAHMLEVCPTIAAGQAAGRDPPARHRRPRGPGPAGLRRGARSGHRARHLRSRRPVPAGAQRGRRRRRRTSRCRSCRSPARCGSRSRTWPPRPSRWITAGGPHHTVLSTAVGTEELADFANMLGIELLIIDGRPTGATSPTEIRWNQAYYRLAQGF